MKLLWVDLEMSGLEVETCRILEIAAIVTDETFKELGEEFNSFHNPEPASAALFGGGLAALAFLPLDHIFIVVFHLIDGLLGRGPTDEG